MSINWWTQYEACARRRNVQLLTLLKAKKLAVPEAIHGRLSSQPALDVEQLPWLLFANKLSIISSVILPMYIVSRAWVCCVGTFSCLVPGFSLLLGAALGAIFIHKSTYYEFGTFISAVYVWVTGLPWRSIILHLRSYRTEHKTHIDIWKSTTTYIPTYPTFIPTCFLLTHPPALISRT